MPREKRHSMANVFAAAGKAFSWFMTAIVLGAATVKAIREPVSSEQLEAPPSPATLFVSHAPKIWPDIRPGWETPQPDRLPKPTYAPATLAFGVALGAAGIVTSFWVSIVGVILFIFGLTYWIGDIA